MKVSSHPGTNQKMLLAQDWPCSYLKAITLEKELAFYSEIWARDILQVHDRLAKKKKKINKNPMQGVYISVCLFVLLCQSYSRLIIEGSPRHPPKSEQLQLH